MDDQNLHGQELEYQNHVGGEPGLTSFPVDISKEEYVRFNQIVSEVSGFLRFRRRNLIIFIATETPILLMLLSEAVMNRSVDSVTLLCLLFFTAIGVFLFFGAAFYVKKAAARAYDQSKMSGQSYYGIIRVYRERIEKQSARATVALNFAEGAVYIENKEMIIIISPLTPAIVIPARCLTPEDTEAVRCAALSGIPMARQRIQSHVVPAAAGPLNPPEQETAGSEWEAEEAISVEIRYSREEFVKIAADTALRTFVKMLPVYSVVSMLAALMFGFLYHFLFGIFVYLFISGGLFAFQVLAPRSRAGRAYDNMNQGDILLKVLLKEAGIEILSRSNPVGVKLAWPVVNRAVERKDSVEFFSESAAITIPKRCIPDFDELRAFVDRHYTARK